MSHHMSDELSDIRRKVLQQRRLGVTIRESMEVTTDMDHMRGELEHRMSTYVLADHIANDQYTGCTTAEWPASTWQMFKQTNAGSWWLGWLVRRHPVQFHTENQEVQVQVSRYLTYPEADLHLPELGRPVIFEQAVQESSSMEFYSVREDD